MDIATLRNKIAAYANRTTASLTVNGVDLILEAVNKSKNWAQRMLDFELASVSVDVVVDLQNGGLLSSAVLHGTSTAVTINRIQRAYIIYTDGGARPADFISRQGFWSTTKAMWDRTEFTPTTSPNSLVIETDSPFVVRQGGTIYVYPNSRDYFGTQTTTTVGLDVVKWMPDYDLVTNTNDFLLDNADEFLLYKSLVDLNFYLKDYERQAACDKQAKTAWDAVVAWNDSISSSTASDDISSLD